MSRGEAAAQIAISQVSPSLDSSKGLVFFRVISSCLVSGEVPSWVVEESIARFMLAVPASF